jgi:predicted nucleic acid-binding protein
MKAFDTNILTQILRGNPAYAERVALIPVAEQALPILAAEEILRGRLHA